ncbi:uncharacterized protein LOC107988366 [Cynoglossus semilaevis]|uniref:uncharacterized protein LOC107988366 n=1 Tax=Cynoglossus semilaevis TaxID=244447 RepID=UPI0007DC92A3|nr:uncharacterized protein LOC107988366 [Cynoglossus semilaevis]
MEDVSVLREQYRQTRDCQRSHTHVLLHGTVSEQLSDAVTIVPVTQSFTSSSPPEHITCSQGPLTFDPWHIHLDLHRRFSCSSLMVAPLQVHSPTLGSYRCSSSSSSSSCDSSVNTRGVNSTPDSQKIHTQTSGCSSAVESSRTSGDQVSGSDDPAQNPGEGSSSPAAGSDARPLGSHSSAHCTSPSSHLQTDLKKNQSSGGKSSTSCRTREQSPSSACLHHNQNLNQNLNHFPFPSRRMPRISEAAKRLGLYSSF